MGKGHAATVHTMCVQHTVAGNGCVYSSKVNVLLPPDRYTSESNWHGTTGACASRPGLHNQVLPYKLCMGSTPQQGAWPCHRALWQLVPPKNVRDRSSRTRVQPVVFSAWVCFNFLEYYLKLKSHRSTYDCIHHAL